MKEQKVSILIPAFNAEAFIRQCLDSIIGQTYRNLQIVVIDDGSKDSTLEICKSYAQKDARLEVFHQDNKGVSSTRNNLLKKVSGDWVLFVDADDWIEPDMVEFLISKVSKNEAEMITCGCVVNDAIIPKGYNVQQWSQDKFVYEFLRHINVSGSLWNKLISSKLLIKQCFQTGISYGEDALFVWNIIQNMESVIITDKQLYHHRVDNHSSLSHLRWSPEKKGTGSLVWRTITKETRKMWPQYANIAQARYAIEDMWGLYYASLANYPYDEHIRERQLNIKRNLSLIKKSGLVSKKVIIAAYAFSYCYKAVRLLRNIY